MKAEPPVNGAGKLAFIFSKAAHGKSASFTDVLTSPIIVAPSPFN
jgi:hypothetical protein